LKIASKPIVSYLKKWDKTAARRPDIFVAISKEVQGRIKEYYGRDSMVIYPSVSLKGLETRDKGLGKKGEGKPYFLIVSRLSRFTKYKRIDLAIQVCNERKLPLKII